jgi:hypothetical protein
MKVYIGPYKNWIGPYQLASKIPFISEDTTDKVGDWLSKTWVKTVCEWIYSKQDRDIKVRIDPYDTWSMSTTLAYIILPMLKQLRDTKHGSCYVDDEDVPPHMRHDGENWVHYKWDWVLNEIIWAFEQQVNDDWEDQFHHGEPDIEWKIVSGSEEDDSAMYEMKQNNPDYWVDYEGIREYNERIMNGARLFGKYYHGLWD